MRTKKDKQGNVTFIYSSKKGEEKIDALMREAQGCAKIIRENSKHVFYNHWVYVNAMKEFESKAKRISECLDFFSLEAIKDEIGSIALFLGLPPTLNAFVKEGSKWEINLTNQASGGKYNIISYRIYVDFERFRGEFRPLIRVEVSRLSQGSNAGKAANMKFALAMKDEDYERMVKNFSKNWEFLNGFVNPNLIINEKKEED